MNDWPSDKDGERLRRLEKDGFDFAVEHKVSFRIEFASWPPPRAALRILEGRYAQVHVVEPRDDDAGHVTVVEPLRLSYCSVVDMQEALGVLVESGGGVYKSWQVLAG